jgi:hypothetical protein
VLEPVLGFFLLTPQKTKNKTQPWKALFTVNRGGGLFGFCLGLWLEKLIETFHEISAEKNLRVLKFQVKFQMPDVAHVTRITHDHFLSKLKQKLLAKIAKSVFNDFKKTWTFHCEISRGLEK